MPCHSMAPHILSDYYHRLWMNYPIVLHDQSMIMIWIFPRSLCSFALLGVSIHRLKISIVLNEIFNVSIDQNHLKNVMSR